MPIENRAELPNIEPTFATFGPRAKTGAVLAGTGQRSPRDGAARAEQRDTRACGAGRRSARARRWPARGGTRRFARGSAGASAALLTPDRTAAAEKAVPCGGATRVLRRQELPAEATEASPPALVSLNHPRTPAPPRPPVPVLTPMMPPCSLWAGAVACADAARDRPSAWSRRSRSVGRRSPNKNVVWVVSIYMLNAVIAARLLAPATAPRAGGSCVGAHIIDLRRGGPRL